nr:MAG TPA: hypothetical protein [Caudoviricetes sp.]
MRAPRLLACRLSGIASRASSSSLTKVSICSRISSS